MDKVTRRVKSRDQHVHVTLNKMVQPLMLNYGLKVIAGFSDFSHKLSYLLTPLAHYEFKGIWQANGRKYGTGAVYQILLNYYYII